MNPMLSHLSDAYCKSAEEVIKQLKSTADGLSMHEVSQRLIQFGYIEVALKKSKHWSLVLLDQFKNSIVYLLLGATPTGCSISAAVLRSKIIGEVV